MVGQFKIYPVGKTEQSKTGKYGYTFLTGLKDDKDSKKLFSNCKAFTAWSEKNYSLELMQPVTAELDVNGEYVKVVRIDCNVI